ncbi:MAG: hypothetical protein M0R03_03830 [Novosphingobium sp.]|jgi:hypothetical protein|nr:hypothetical protein [Novosphingobium sp.]
MKSKNREDFIVELIEELDRLRDRLVDYQLNKCSYRYNVGRASCRRASMDLTRKLAGFRRIL